MQGLHLIADAYELECGLDILVRADLLETLCGDAARAAGLTVLSTTFYAFDAPPPTDGQPALPGGGVTGTVLLAESHAAIHTWPELGAATLDVYVCNYQQDNRAKAQALFDAILKTLRPARTRVDRVMRGDLTAPDAEPNPLELEWLDEDMAFGFRARARVFSEHSPWQHVQIFDTRSFGRVMKIDEHFMTSERDEFFYHEALVHPAALTHPAPRQALIVGGGDGGAARQLLRHPSIERVTLAELDQTVVDAARAYLGNIHRGSLDDTRLDLRIGDGLQYLADVEGHHDLILFDLTDPGTPAHPLYSPHAFALAKHRLAPGGAFISHVGSPTFGAERVRSQVAMLREAFPLVRIYGTYVPLYGCYWCMAICSESLDPLQLDETTVAQRMAARDLNDLSLYSPRMHRGLFALPAFVEALTCC